MSLLTSTELKRVFKFKKNGKEIELADINPQISPEEVLKFHSGQYPELTTAKIKTEYEGSNIIVNVSTEVGTKG